MLTPVLHISSGQWMLGMTENHVARPLTREEIEALIEDVERLRRAVHIANDKLAGLRDAAENARDGLLASASRI